MTGPRRAAPRRWTSGGRWFGPAIPATSVDRRGVGQLLAVAAVALAGAGFALRFLPARAAAGAPTPVLDLAPDALVAVD